MAPSDDPVDHRLVAGLTLHAQKLPRRSGHRTGLRTLRGTGRQIRTVRGSPAMGRHSPTLGRRSRYDYVRRGALTGRFSCTFGLRL
ncbi:hypothetical protein MMAGJ_58020 [Mycolicibacterium mageritense]|uniref:Uncharacterized protein n=1 Tax=Mycolicibacterium mageritense TaxID=53462 RepID=A0ABN5YEV6_MYCME|nr:hypothetical protein MMAGJ_58020 [Mycolicibacterium mageritense]